ncbi:MAG: hypothetical protein JWO90_1999 [Solirubrobacterales bacterium]|jgi:ketosteroid isomerase-like protein|nr:hypothetical protein [Solirubrobacterales bacterium]
MDAAAVVREFFAAFADRDPERMRSVVHPACRFWPQGTAEAVGRSEPYVGHEGMLAFFEDAARAWDVLDLQATDARVAGTGVVCFGVAVGRLRGNPEELRIPVIWVFRLQDGAVVFGRGVRSAAEARELVGADPQAHPSTGGS